MRKEDAVILQKIQRSILTAINADNVIQVLYAHDLPVMTVYAHIKFNSDCFVVTEKGSVITLSMTSDNIKKEDVGIYLINLDDDSSSSLQLLSEFEGMYKLEDLRIEKFTTPILTFNSENRLVMLYKYTEGAKTEKYMLSLSVYDVLIDEIELITSKLIGKGWVTSPSSYIKKTLILITNRMVARFKYNTGKG